MTLAEGNGKFAAADVLRSKGATRTPPSAPGASSFGDFGGGEWCVP